MTNPYRTERDSLGEMQVPRDAVHGIHTARALENFTITGVRLSIELCSVYWHYLLLLWLVLFYLFSSS